MYPQDKIIADYVEIGYDYFALHFKYSKEDNLPACRILHSLHKNRQLPLKSRTEVKEEES